MLYISKKTASTIAKAICEKASGMSFKITFRARCDADTRQLAQGYVIELYGSDGSFLRFV